MGLFDKLKQKKKDASLSDTPTKRYEFTETGEKVLVDDNYRPNKKTLFNKENKQRFVSGAKRTGKALHSGAKKFGEMQRQADMREAKRSSSRRESSGFDFAMTGFSEQRGGRKQRRESYDFQGGFIGSDNGPTASDITDSLLGTGGGSKQGRRKKNRDMFDFSDL